MLFYKLAVINYITITEIIDDKIPSYHNNYLPERYNEALLKKE